MYIQQNAALTVTLVLCQVLQNHLYLLLNLFSSYDF